MNLSSGARSKSMVNTGKESTVRLGLEADWATMIRQEERRRAERKMDLEGFYIYNYYYYMLGEVLIG